MDDRLYRSRTDRILSGVAGGLADRLDLDPSVVRVVWVLLVLPTGFLALLAYVVMAIVVPDEPLGVASASPTPAPMTAADAGPAGADPTVAPGDGNMAGGPAAPIDWRAQRRAERHARRAAQRTGTSSGALIFGIVLVVLGTIFLARQFIPAIDFDLVWPVALIALGVAFVVASIQRDRPPS